MAPELKRGASRTGDREHMDLGKGKSSQTVHNRGSILAADISVGEQLSDGYAIETVFARRERKTGPIRRCIDWIKDYREYLYASHLLRPEPPEEDESRRRKLSTRSQHAG